MPVASTISTYLEEHRIKHWLVPHDATDSLEQAGKNAGVPLARIARGVLLRDESGFVLAVLPLTHLVDFSALEQLLGRSMVLAAADDARHVFRDCAPGCVPPVAAAYVLDVVVDESLRAYESIYFEPGSHTDLIRLDGEDFIRLQGSEARFADFTHPEDHLVSTFRGDPAGEVNVPDSFEIPVDVSALTPALEMKARVQQIYELPAMPQLAQSLLRLQGNPDATIQELAEIVELDPSLAAQVVRYACSPFFGYRGKVESIHDAITRVLGFDMVMHMAIGIAAGGRFRNPPDGPLGLNAFWQHATYSAAIAQSLVRYVSRDSELKPGMAYLAGLLHNFGFLLLGHLFQPEFYLLNKLVSSNPQVPVTVLEKQVLGLGQARGVLDLGHAEIGAWLMEHWGMPAEVVVALRYHHDPDYQGAHQDYARLMLVVDHLLKIHHIGDGDSDDLPGAALDELGLDAQDVLDLADNLMENHERLDEMVRQLVA